MQLRFLAITLPSGSGNSFVVDQMHLLHFYRIKFVRLEDLLEVFENFLFQAFTVYIDVGVEIL